MIVTTTTTNNKVEDVVHTKAEFHQFREERQQIVGENMQGIVTLIARKLSHNNNDQYIHRHTNYKKNPF